MESYLTAQLKAYNIVSDMSELLDDINNILKAGRYTTSSAQGQKERANKRFDHLMDTSTHFVKEPGIQEVRTLLTQNQ